MIDLPEVKSLSQNHEKLARRKIIAYRVLATYVERIFIDSDRPTKHTEWAKK